MNFIGIFFILFGLIVIVFPEIIAYLIGFFFLIIGLNMVILPYLMRRKVNTPSSSWKVGSYEITRKK